MKLYCSWAPSSLHRHRYFHRLHCSLLAANTYFSTPVCIWHSPHTHSHSVNVDEIAGTLFKWVQNVQDGPYTVWTLPNEHRVNGKKMERIIYSTKKIKIMHKVWIKYVHFLWHFWLCVRGVDMDSLRNYASTFVVMKNAATGFSLFRNWTKWNYAQFMTNI